ncbi:hypothetical protein ACVOMT_05900 [Sphingomonas panni]
MTINDLERIMLEKRRACVDATKSTAVPANGEERARLARLMTDAHFARDSWEIARDYGLQMALLFKLSDGLIDPRYPD